MKQCDERGSALLAAVGVLSVMTLLAMMSLLAGGADLVISMRLARERSVFYAAESALATTMDELVASGGLIPEPSFHAPWPAPGIAVRRWQDGEWANSRRVCLIPDLGDADGDPATTVVLFNRGFGHAASPLSQGGYPVVQLLVAAEGGESRQTLVAEVAPVTCAPAISAAWTAAGPLDLAGDIRVEGTTSLLAVAGRSPIRLFDGAVIDGASITNQPQSPLADVITILNAGGTLSRLEDLPEPSASGILDGLSWSRGDYSGPLGGRGIFVVHNPAFDPVKHEASRLAIEESIFVEDRDPAYSHLDPSRRPARLEVTGGGSFSGLIVADSVGSVTTRFTLTGALITIARFPQTVTARSPLLISGDRLAVEQAGRGALRHLLAFRPVVTAAGEEDQCRWTAAP